MERKKDIRRFRDLEVYQRGFQAAMKIFEVTKKFPVDEKYSMVDQIRRSSRSVCSNLSLPCEISVLEDVMFYFTYVLLSTKDNGFYTGYTENLENRLSRHNNGEVTSTRRRTPLKLVYYEACPNKEDALRREKYLKTTYGKRYIRNRLKQYLIGSKDQSIISSAAAV